MKDPVFGNRRCRGANDFMIITCSLRPCRGRVGNWVFSVVFNEKSLLVYFVGHLLALTATYHCLLC